MRRSVFNGIWTGRIGLSVIYHGILEEDGEFEVMHFGAVSEQDSLQCSASVCRERQLCFVVAAWQIRAYQIKSDP